MILYLYMYTVQVREGGAHQHRVRISFYLGSSSADYGTDVQVMSPLSSGKHSQTTFIIESVLHNYVCEAYNACASAFTPRDDHFSSRVGKYMESVPHKMLICAIFRM